MLPCDALISWLVHFKVTGSGWSDFKSWPDLLGVVSLLSNYMLVYKEGKKKRERRGCGYWHSGGGEGDGERELLTLSKLANPSASRALRRGGEEGAKGSAKGSFAGREEEEEEEEKSPEVCGMKFPRRWKESEDSVRLMDDFLPDRAQTGRLSKGRFYFMNTVGTSPDVW